LKARHPASLHICTLLDKPARRRVPVPVTYTGFTIPDDFVVGYGLDFDQRYRNLPFVAILNPDQV
ncbi:MAG: hypoxanthine phosphoribosyltransferase, partial [bacterium]|nr:hypoxanthine phosphoribosyltransferase [bacterium]